MQGDSVQHQLHPAATNVPERRAGSLLSQMLRAEICSRSILSFLTEAHDALSGAIAKRAGFKGLWASGLSIASSLGYRDANEASLHIVDVLKLIDEIAKLAFLGKRNALDQHRRTNSCSYPDILLEFRTGPDRNARNTRFGCRRANLAEASAARKLG
ncbi:isocitrate lyase/phosphoenolpyruvate mutase family protein [Bradyrhizobium diazoefficiens]|uniref:isocitrate lyase/phosphoenolpyruvate mutase family protein n=1 Tax=Bradyrhizobium diazoefficiens TaxID=1355477 RepID=UPI003D9B72EF